MMDSVNPINYKFMFNNVEYDEFPQLKEIDGLIVDPLSLQNCMQEEGIILKDSGSLGIGYYESNYKYFKSFDTGLKSTLFSIIKTYGDYLTSAYTSAIRFIN